VYPAGFGTFKRTETAARKGRNPKTGDELDIPASARPSFSAGARFKQAVKAGLKK
jgi:DNA-binding protein HU-beta